VAWLAVIPKSALALAVAVLTALLVAQTLVAERSATKLAEERAGRASDRAQATAAAASAAEVQRAREQEWSNRYGQIEQEAANALQTLATHRAAADVAAGGLRDAARAAAARSRAACPRAPAAPGSAPAADPADLLADVLGELEQAGRELATEAGKRRDAGLTCERAHDALR
jgi:hypothetical protein